MKKVTAVLLAAVLFIGGITPVNINSKTRVRLSKKSITIEKGKSKTIQLFGVKARIKWTVSNKKKASLKVSGRYNKKCRVRGKKTGKVKVTAKYRNKKYVCNVRIKLKKAPDKDPGKTKAPTIVPAKSPNAANVPTQEPNTTIAPAKSPEAVTTPTAIPGIFTNSRAAERIAVSCDDYGGKKTAEEILGDFSSEEALTNASCVTMLYRGFGRLPEPKGSNWVFGYRDTAFKDVSKDIKEYVDNLTDAMIYVPKDNEKFEPEAAVSEKELVVLIKRIFAYLRTNLKDDFFAVANKDLLSQADEELFDPRGYYCNFLHNEDFFDWTNDLLKKSRDGNAAYEDKPYLKNIANYYSTYMSREGRENGNKILKSYMDEIIAAKNAEELLPVIEKITNETGLPLLMLNCPLEKVFYTKGDTRNYAMEFNAPSYSAEPDDYKPEGDKYNSDFVHCYTQALILLGFDEEEASGIVKAGYANRGNIGYLQNQKDKKGISDRQFDMAEYLKLAGYSLDESDINGNYQDYRDIMFELMENEDTYYAYQCGCVCYLLSFARNYVGPRVTDWCANWWISFYDENLEWFNDAANIENMLFIDIYPDICEAFYDEFDVESECKKLDSSFSQCKNEFADMIRSKDWLSDKTKAAALKKLAAMKMYIGCEGDFFEKERGEYISLDDGGTMFENHCIATKVNNLNDSKGLKSDMNDAVNFINIDINPLKSNCYMIERYNSIYISITFLYNDFMFTDKEEYYANMALTLGHEITHGFDRDGCQYDENGKKSDWWTPEDKKAFDERCERVKEHYAKTEFAPGLRCDSDRTNGEDVSDIGGMKIALGVVKKIDGFDYDSFFRNIAKENTVLCTRNYFTAQIYPDPHSANGVRVNPLFSLVDEFYETYGIGEGDGMYVPKEERVSVW